MGSNDKSGAQRSPNSSRVYLSARTLSKSSDTNPFEGRLKLDATDELPLRIGIQAAVILQ